MIGDRAATAIDVAIAPGSTATCPDLAGRGAAVLFTAADGSSEAGDYDWGIVEGARSRYIFIELGEERSVLVDISAPTEEFEEFVGRAMEVVGTFHFE